MNVVRLSSDSYWLSSHNSDRFSNMPFKPGLTGLDDALSPASSAGGAPPPKLKRSNICDVSILSKLELSWLMTVLAMFNLNCWRLQCNGCMTAGYIRQVIISLHDLLFKSSSSHQPINIHNFLLSNSMSSVHSLWWAWSDHTHYTVYIVVQYIMNDTVLSIAVTMPQMCNRDA